MFLPLKNIYISQGYGKTPFAQEHIEWYKNGIHYGIDFSCKIGTNIYASISGVVNTYTNDAGGLVVDITNENKRVMFCHLSDKLVNSGERVKEGQLICLSGNSGKFTTGPHLHFSYLENGGYQNPKGLFTNLFDGTPINNKDAEKSYCYHRYGMKSRWLDEFSMKFKNPWLHKKLQNTLGIKIPSTEICNSLVYGNWDIETVLEPSMYCVWSEMTKDDYKKALSSMKK